MPACFPEAIVLSDKCVESSEAYINCCFRTDSVERLPFKLLIAPTIPLKKMDKGFTGHYPNSAGESRPSCVMPAPTGSDAISSSQSEA